MTAVPAAYTKSALLWQMLMDPEFDKHRCNCQARTEDPKNCPMHKHLFAESK